MRNVGLLTYLVITKLLLLTIGFQSESEARDGQCQMFKVLPKKSRPNNGDTITTTNTDYK